MTTEKTETQWETKYSMGRVEQSEKYKQLTGYGGLDFKEDPCGRRRLFSEKMASPSRSPRRRWMAPRPRPKAVDPATTTHCPAFLRSVQPREEHTSYSVTSLILGACARRLDATHRLTLLRGAGLPPGAPETGRSSFLQEGEGSCHWPRTPESRLLVLRKVRLISGHSAGRMTAATL